MTFAASLFLGGKPLLSRGFQVCSVSSGEVVLDYCPPESEAGRAPTGAPWRGFADGAWFQQPLGARESATAGHTMWCGDLDSCGTDEQKAILNPDVSPFTEKMILPADKNLSDGAALLDRCYAHLCAEALRTRPASGVKCPELYAVEVIGAFGGRRDHEQINLAELKHVFFRLAPAAAVGWVVVLQPSVVLAASNTAVVIRGLPRGTPVSILSSGQDLRMHLEGLQYSGEMGLERPSHGLSNEAREPSVVVRPVPKFLCAEEPLRPRAPFFELIIGHDESAYFG